MTRGTGSRGTLASAAREGKACWPHCSFFPVAQSSVVALPLNLSGAVCTPDAEYTKKTNCFRLQ